MDGEIKAKIKFAKYQAVRIAKALKAGEDPNLSNPSPDPAPDQDPGAVDVSGTPAQDLQSGFQQPSVEEVPDEQHRHEASMARTSSLDQSLHPSRAPSLPRPPPVDVPPSATAPNAAENFYQGTANGEVSPLGPPSAGPALSEGGGYFPQVPPVNTVSPPVLPSTPSNDTGAFGAVRPAPSPQYPPPPSSATQAHHFSPPVPGPNPQVPHGYPPPAHGPYAPAYQPPFQGGLAAPPPSAPQPQPQPPATSDLSEEAVAKAQKHARWAISALNFDDVPTAIEELRGALQSLGAR